MIERVIGWLGRRQAVLHGVDQTTSRAESRLRHVERVVEAQRQDGDGAAVNLIYDRLTHHVGEAHG